MTITLSSLSKVARAAAFILTACGTLAFAQPKAEKAEVAPRTPVNTDEAGILVSSVESGSPAEKAGIARGDIILEVGGTAVNDYAALQSAIGSRKPGDKVEVKIRHGDTESTVSLTLANKSGKPYAGVSVSPSGRGSLSQRKLDRQRNPRATPLLPAPQPRLMLTGPGAVISNVVAGGPAEKAGLKKGDIIESVDGTAIDAANSLGGLITARKVGDSVTLSVRTGAQKPRDVKVVLEKNPEKDAPYLGVEYAMVNRRFGQAVPMPWGAPGPMAGVLVSSVAADSPAAKAGLKDQDLITAIEGVPVQSPQSVAKGVAARKPGESLTLTVYRTSEAKEIAIKATLGENPNDKTKGYLGISMSSLPGPGMDFRNWRQPGVAMPAPDPLSKSPGI